MSENIFAISDAFSNSKFLPKLPRKVMSQLKSIPLTGFTTESGFSRDLTLSYQTFGQEIGKAPIVLVNHALTGNSSVTGKKGWWNDLIGPNKVIDTNRFCVLAFDIPGNGYTGNEQDLIHAFEEYSLRDIANIFLTGLSELKVEKLYAIIGGSIGGSLAWEIATLKPNLTENLIPIAADWKATDWLVANVRVQKQILNNSNQPLEDARMHAMNFYRTAASYKQKFARTKTDNQTVFNVESWLLHHGDKLKERFSLSSYKLLNHLLGTGDISRDTSGFAAAIDKVTADIHIVGIDTDGFYVHEENFDTLEKLANAGKKANLSVINSIHGHDAFLIEFEQLQSILAPIFACKQSVDSKLTGLEKCA